jgi:hypothetical protein
LLLRLWLFWDYKGRLSCSLYSLSFLGFGLCSGFCLLALLFVYRACFPHRKTAKGKVVMFTINRDRALDSMIVVSPEQVAEALADRAEAVVLSGFVRSAAQDLAVAAFGCGLFDRACLNMIERDQALAEAEQDFSPLWIGFAPEQVTDRALLAAAVAGFCRLFEQVAEAEQVDQVAAAARALAEALGGLWRAERAAAQVLDRRAAAFDRAEAERDRAARAAAARAFHNVAVALDRAAAAERDQQVAEAAAARAVAQAADRAVAAAFAYSDRAEQQAEQAAAAFERAAEALAEQAEQAAAALGFLVAEQVTYDDPAIHGFWAEHIGSSFGCFVIDQAVAQAERAEAEAEQAAPDRALRVFERAAEQVAAAQAEDPAAAQAEQVKRALVAAVAVVSAERAADRAEAEALRAFAALRAAAVAAPVSALRAAAQQAAAEAAAQAEAVAFVRAFSFGSVPVSALVAAEQVAEAVALVDRYIDTVRAEAEAAERAAAVRAAAEAVYSAC